MIERQDKYFLCFGFENFSQKNLKDFHVTIAYFGELKERDVNSIIEIVNYMYSKGDLKYISEKLSVFSIPEMFGANKNVPVLLREKIGTSTQEGAWKKAEQLQNMLGAFRKGDLYEWDPHITTSLTYFSGRINTMFLCKNDYTPVARWGLE